MLTKRSLLFIILICLSQANLNAAVISYAGYTYDDSTNVIVGGGLEWLRWDATLGHTVESALGIYSSDGWEVASNAQMSELFNAFVFGYQGTWDSDENTYQAVTIPWGSSEDTVINTFIDMFGYTHTVAGDDYYPDDPFTAAFVYFGRDPDADGVINSVLIMDDYTFIAGDYPVDAFVSLRNEDLLTFISAELRGIALVREAEIPNPATLALIGLGLALVGFSYFKRKNY